LRTVRAADTIGELQTFEGFKDPTAKCPDCSGTLDDRIWGEAVFRLCRRHGVWLESWARARFHKTLAAATKRLQSAAADLGDGAVHDLDDQAAYELADRLRAKDPSGLLDLARRIIALERRIELLESK
ncbi:MAG: hypothetical protein H0T42_23630, partial [Deltaproteobacteria bacterium]|nr:hypothetical protein [Deltaproteobacteria bacterium]